MSEELKSAPVSPEAIKNEEKSENSTETAEKAEESADKADEAGGVSSDEEKTDEKEEN